MEVPSMTKDQFIAWALRHGYKPDRFGHYQKDTGEKVIRLKLSSIAVRYEIKSNICGRNEWIRIKSGYYSKLSLSSEDKLQGLSR